jgi:hypothetical protein
VQLFRLATAVVLVSASVVPMSALAEASPTCFGRPATIVGTDGDDVIRGTDGSDVIVAGAGADLIRGRAGNDFICAGDNPWRPNQSIEDPYEWTDRVFAGDGDDTVDGGPSANEIHGGNGRDILFAGGDLPLYYLCQDVSGGAGNDVLYGSAGWDCLRGKAGNDVAFGGLADDFLYGGDGDDQMSGGPGDDGASGGRGDDRIRLGRGKDHGFGGMGADMVSGGPGGDVLFGLDFFPRDDPEPRPSDQGGNVLRGQAGADRLDGGTGESNRNLGGTGFDLCRNPTAGQGALGCERDW